MNFRLLNTKQNIHFLFIQTKLNIMSKKFSNTTADYLQWEEMLNLIRKLYNDEKYKMSLFISIGSFWGLRVADILKLRWEDIINVSELSIIENKTGKTRLIRVNQQLQKHILDCHQKINPSNPKSHIFLSQKGGVYTIQRINTILKEIKTKYKLNIKNFSSHTLRKTFGRQVFNVSGDNSEMALIKLMEIFNHSSMNITKRYLGLKEEEIRETYDLLTF